GLLPEISAVPFSQSPFHAFSGKFSFRDYMRDLPAFFRTAGTIFSSGCLPAGFSETSSECIHQFTSARCTPLKISVSAGALCPGNADTGFLFLRAFSSHLLECQSDTPGTFSPSGSGTAETVRQQETHRFL